MLNRSIAPQAKPFAYIPLPNYEVAYLDNGIPVYYCLQGSVDVCEIQAVFRAGSGFSTKVGLSDFTPRMMSEGTRHFTSLALAEKLDFYGAHLEYDEGVEFISINLTCLTHIVGDTLPLLREVIQAPTFPDAEFRKLQQRTVQKLVVNHKKSAYQAAVHFPKLVFGKEHVYSHTTDIAEVKALSTADLIAYHKQYLQTGNMFLTVCGQFKPERVLQKLNIAFGKKKGLSAKNEAVSDAVKPFSSVKPGRYHIEVEGVQSSLRVGHIGVARNHPDATKMELVNTILGGYFGSRLMSNIREDKGATYGVYSSWVTMQHGGYFVIQCDVANHLVDSTIVEMKKEITRLQEELISEEELNLVKTYRIGKSIGERETPFQINNLIRFSVTNQIPFTAIDEKFAIFDSMTPQDVQDLARKHLRVEDLIELVCGKKEDGL